MKRLLSMILTVLMLILGLMLTAEAKAKPTLRIQKISAISTGSYYTIEVYWTGSGDVPEDVTLTAKNAKIVKVHEATWMEEDCKVFRVYGLKAGTTTLTAKSASTKTSHSAQITVKANAYALNKPYKEKPKGVYASLKKMAYSGDDLVLDVFIYNKLGKTIYGLTDISIQMREIEGEKGPASGVIHMDQWIPKGGKIRNGKYGVMRVRFPIREMTEDGLHIDPYNLRKPPDIWPSLSFQVVQLSKGLRMPIPKTTLISENTTSASMDYCAIPEDTYFMQQ